MIIKMIMELLKAFLLFVIGLFPKLPDMTQLAQSLEALVKVFLTIDSFISVQLVGLCLGFCWAFANVDLIWSVIMWVLKKIPGVD